jgi:hypothetical protein
VGLPWRKIADLAVGGLTEVGFAGPSLLLVVSHQGRSVVDCSAGGRVARDRQETGDWFDAAGPAAAGIGPLAGQWIAVAGLAGGHLPTVTADGWRACLVEDGAALSSPDGASMTVPEPEGIRMFGFSPDGAVFVLGSPPHLVIFTRDSGTTGQ